MKCTAQVVEGIAKDINDLSREMHLYHVYKEVAHHQSTCNLQKIASIFIVTLVLLGRNKKCRKIQITRRY